MTVCMKIRKSIKSILEVLDNKIFLIDKVLFCKYFKMEETMEEIKKVEESERWKKQWKKSKSG